MLPLLCIAQASTVRNAVLVEGAIMFIGIWGREKKITEHVTIADQQTGKR